MSYRILVTGGAGYIGSMLTPELVSLGHEVTVVDNFMYQQQSLSAICSSKNFNLIKGDVRDLNLMNELISKHDIIIPLAAYVGMPLCKKEPVSSEEVNKTATLYLIKNLSKSQLVMMPTTNSAYGSGDISNYCDEKSRLNPISEYARQKVFIEEKLMERENSISFRLATVFGMSPRLRLDLLVNDFTWKAFKHEKLILFESHFKRNYIHVKDVARVFIHGMNNFHKMKENIYNVGLSDANISKKELCLKIQKHLPSFIFEESLTGEDPDKRNYIVSNEKIEKTGFKPVHSLEDGIEELIKGFPMIESSNAILSNI